LSKLIQISFYKYRKQWVWIINVKLRFLFKTHYSVKRVENFRLHFKCLRVRIQNVLVNFKHIFDEKEFCEDFLDNDERIDHWVFCLSDGKLALCGSFIIKNVKLFNHVFEIADHFFCLGIQNFVFGNFILNISAI